MNRVSITSLHILNYLLLTLLVAGCVGNSTITRSYVDPHVGKLDLEGVLIVAVAKQESSRIDFETAFARALERQGVRAITSNSLGLREKDGADKYLAAAAQANLDTILVTRYVGEKAEDIYHPGTIYYDVMPAYGGYGYGRYGGFGGYYGHAYEVAYQQPVWTTNKTYTLISDLFATSDKMHLYQAISDTIQAGGRGKLRDDMISGFVSDMKKQGLLD